MFMHEYSMCIGECVCVCACNIYNNSNPGLFSFFLHGGIEQLFNGNTGRSHRGHLVQSPYFAKGRLKARRREICLSFDFFFFAFQSFPSASHQPSDRMRLFSLGSFCSLFLLTMTIYPFNAFSSYLIFNTINPFLS